MGIRAGKNDIKKWKNKGLIPKGYDLDGTAPKRHSVSPDVATGATVKWSITLSVPCRILSEPNRREHWSVKRQRQTSQADALFLALYESGIEVKRLRMPLVVTWVHIGGKLDGDNLSGGFKKLRDSLAEKLEIDDGDEMVEWRYEQYLPSEGGKYIGSPGVKLRIEGGSPDSSG